MNNACPQFVVPRGPDRTEALIQTSRRGDRLAELEPLAFRSGRTDNAVVRVWPDRQRQTLLGIGSSFTESAAFVLAHLDPEARAEVMRRAFSRDGADFAMARTPIGACDFCVDGRYSYADVADDECLTSFSIRPDLDGFNRERFAGIRDERYDLLPMIREAQAIKAGQSERSLRIVASAWTAPAWMKDIEDWYRPGPDDHGRPGTGGRLKPEHQRTYARYLARYLQAYREQGVDIWAITPVNEPAGNNGRWESMHFSPETQRDFIRDYLGPVLQASGNDRVRILFYDHNRAELCQWADTLLADPDCARHLHGAAVHWYDSTFKVYEEQFEALHARYPDCRIIHTEGCIDDLGNAAPPGVLDPVGYRESGWFGNDDFWWAANATDWAYTATWPGVRAEDHPRYAPVHRYARDIIVGMNHWLSGWIDWNLVLDHRGGPNHVGNHCGAPIMIDTAGGRIHYTPVFDVLTQFSRAIRPGDRVVESRIESGCADSDGLYALATLNPAGRLNLQLLNLSDNRCDYAVALGERLATGAIESGALQTIPIDLAGR